MAQIVLFHSMLGLRPAERRAAERLRASGHDVVTPDLFDGRTASTIEEGFVLKDEQIGWPTIEQRAREAVRSLPADTVLAGISMGGGVVHTLLPSRPDTAGVLLLHGVAEIRTTARAGLPIQLHISDADPFAPRATVASWQDGATRAGADLEVFSYPKVGHYFTDPDLADHDEHAATLTWRRVLDFLRRIGP
ncbi:dienelactone hydrolase family protein [Nonomuraea sp. NPDC050783]|uniref:dienelactone hydrolase family protein n=1 Tax=Nonomuraea sp. NPDC050783 TaxID=3154634 RepID=UPI003465208A